MESDMVKKVYDSIIDEKSKKIYTNRLLNYITDDMKYYLDIIRLNDYENEQAVTISKYYDEIIGSGAEIIVWGAGSSGKTRLNFNKWLGYDGIKYFVDSNSGLQQEGCLGKPVVSPSEFAAKWDGELILIESLYYEKEIEEQIKSFLGDKCTIIKHPVREMQYFDEIIKLDDNEVFLDCGCYDCGTVNDFINRVNGKYSRVISFEPDTINYENCKKIVEDKKWNNVEVINKGLWDKVTTLSFYNGLQTDSRIVECEEDIYKDDVNDAKSIEKIEVTDIDTIMQGERVTFIKMDIEGSELKALQGAEETIKKYKPKLAISIYHKPEDIVEIPAYLKEIVPEYKFKIRHYTDHAYETVLYAVVE